jgi:hypothetical protein
MGFQEEGDTESQKELDLVGYYTLSYQDPDF